MTEPSLRNFLRWRADANGTEALTAVDAAWLRMDRPTNLMMICGMMMFAGRLRLEALKQIVRERVLCFHRFRQRVADKEDRPRWEDDPYFDLDWHVRRIALPEGEGALEEVIGDLISTPLDPTKPMWQYHLIDNAVGGGSALLLRIHHCYGDGFALLHVVDAMTDRGPAGMHVQGRDVTGQDDARSAWERIFGSVTEAVGDAVRASLAVAGASRDLLLNPMHAVGYAKTTADIAYEAAVIASMTPDSPTRLKGPLGVMKRVAWADPLALFDVKAVAEALDCTVNDVLVSCVAGALRTYLLERGEPVQAEEVRALVPVNLRPPGRITELGNQFGLVFLELPVAMEDPVARVFEVHKRMAELRHSRQPLVAFGILAGMGMAPEFIKERVLESLAANASAVITNVQGPDEPRWLAGSRITRQMFWVPQSGGIGLGISVLSYAGEIAFGVVADTRRVPDPDAITKHFQTEFGTLLLTMLMMPWPMAAASGQRPAR